MCVYVYEGACQWSLERVLDLLEFQGVSKLPDEGARVRTSS